jgi:acetyl esterase
MTDRWDPEMRAARQKQDEAAAKLPPVLLTEPLGPHRAVSEQLAMMWGEGGPRMADSREHWLAVRWRRVLCRVHKPSTDAALPALLWFHGGGWVFHSIDTHDRLAREYAAASGIAVVLVDYPLAPETRFPGAVLDCTEVVRALATADWGLDASRLVLGGDSSGGNIAFATALALRDSGGPALRGILALYPVTDADFTSPSYRAFADGYGLTTPAMQAYWDIYVRDPADRLNPLAAPLRGDLTGLPPTLIQLAELDVLHSDGERMAQKMQAAGVPVTLETYKGMLHGFMRLMDAVTGARTAIASASKWLRQVTG